jgi:signal transduction histidine kinase
MVRFRPSLIALIMTFLGGLLLLTWLLFSLLAFKTAENDLYAQKREHARTFLAAFVSQLPETVPTFPGEILAPDSSAAIYAQKLLEEAVFTRLTLLDRNGRPIFSAGREGSDIYLPFVGLSRSTEGSFVRSDGSGITHIMSVTRNGMAVARVGLVMSLEPEKARLSRTKQLLIAYFVLDFVLLLTLGSFALSRIVVNPINRLLAATERITGGHYGQRLHVSGSSELARLAESFNQMSDALVNKERQVAEQVTALEKANFDLRQARELAFRSEKMASIGLLAAGMAHEVGTPLAAVMGYAELLGGEEQDDSVTRDYARRISQECGRIDRIVRGLLDFSRPRTSDVEPVDIPGVIRDSIELLTQQGAFKRIRVTTYFQENLSPALADAHQLQQVVINLMLNSRDAMPDGGKLSVRATNGGEEVPGRSRRGVLVEVRDSGCGIPAEQLESVFEPFFTTKPPGRGTGLGLAIAARIIEGLGGSIAARSTVGRGSCFTLWLPAITTRGT